VAVVRVRRFRGLVEWMTCNNLRRRDYCSATQDERTHSFRSVRVVEMHCDELSSVTASTLQDWRTALALAWRASNRAARGRSMCSCSTAARNDEIDYPRTWILFNCSSTSNPTCIVIFVCRQFAHGVALASPASSQEKVLVHVTWPCASSLPHSMSRLICGRSIPCGEDPGGWATADDVKHSYSRFVKHHGSLNSGAFRDSPRRASQHSDPSPMSLRRVAHRQLQT
jgi:hypothetical protein